MNQPTTLSLTQSQSLLWTGQQLLPESPLYNMVLTFDIYGEINSKLFCQAFLALTQSSDSLRTVFKPCQGHPEQRVLETMNRPPTLLDFSKHPRPQKSVQGWLKKRSRDRLELTQCCFDSALIKLGEKHFFWYLNQHHLITDAWASSLIYQRMAQFYRLALTGKLDQAPTLPQYMEFVGFEQSQRPDKEQAKAYWQQQQETTASLHFYGRKPARKKPDSFRLTLPLGPTRTWRLKLLAEQKGIRSLNLHMTLFNLFATALFSYLFRVTDCARLALGCPAHNRHTMDFRNTIGLFMELFPLHTELIEQETFRSLLGKVAAAGQGFFRHAQPGSSSAESSRQFQVVMNYIHATFPSFNEYKVNPAWVHPDCSDPSHLLRLQIHDFENSGNIVLNFDFNLASFNKHQAKSAQLHFLSLLDAFIQDPDLQIIKAPLLAFSAQEETLAGTRPVKQPVAQAHTVLDLFDQQVNRYPNKPALRQENKCLSYIELDRASRTLATYLVEFNRDKNLPIGLCLPRSMDMIIALIAILRAGTAYVPLTPDLPDKRLDYLIEDTGIELVLTYRDLKEKFSPQQSCLCLDSTWDKPETNHLPRVSSADLAYILYTSGTSGTPKGVEVLHRGLFNYVSWAQDTYASTPGLTFPLFTSLGFDLTLTSIFVPLTSGGSLEIYLEQQPKDLSVLQVFTDNKVDVVKLTPAHLSLLQGLDLSQSRIKTLILGGEALTSQLARAITSAMAPDVKIYNEYGPTEAVVGCMIHRFNHEQDTGSKVPIGSAIPGVSIYLLDAGLNPVPPGVTGEIHICGASLARGYLNLPELTKLAFVDNPHNPGQKMYSSGDLARYNAKGELEYLDRKDKQVKFNGVRIEPGEIEAQLLQHPLIEQCTLQLVHQRQKDPEPKQHCTRCGLPSNYPGSSFDSRGLCHLCSDFDTYQDKVQAYFKDLPQLRALFRNISNNRRGDFDCLMLLSGGKDSSYALYQLAKMGLKIYAVTLDNGFISDGAKANVSQAVTTLGIPHTFVTTPYMNEIFKDSLKLHSNVCQGCFKTLYSLALKIAHKKSIPAIVTGLSRGQFFETRLTPELFKDNENSEIDQTVLSARKAYHRMDDLISRRLDVKFLQDDRVFEQIQFIDFYRYCDVSLHEMLSFLELHAPWIRPQDTGRSTNCLINDVGIHIHKRKQGYHNYALPYSWDVRLGHKSRDQAQAELSDDIQLDKVYEVLKTLAYDDEAFFQHGENTKLTAYYIASEPLNTTELRQFLSNALPAEMLPSYLIQLAEFPLTRNGKLDVGALPDPLIHRDNLPRTLIQASSLMEKQLADLWRNVLQLDRLCIQDNFFELGGDSIAALQIVAGARDKGIHLAPDQLFTHQTLASLAKVARFKQIANEPVQLPGQIPLTPIQNWFFSLKTPNPDHWNHVQWFDVDMSITAAEVSEALNKLMDYHDALKLSFTQSAGQWRQDLSDTSKEPAFYSVELSGLTPLQRREKQSLLLELLYADINIKQGKLFAAALLTQAESKSNRLIVVIHHLVMDSLSWLILLDDLGSLLSQPSVRLPAKTASLTAWGQYLSGRLQPALAEKDYWEQQLTGSSISTPPANTLCSSAEHFSFELTLSNELRAPVNEILLYALTLALSAQYHSQNIRIDTEHHGREVLSGELNVSRTLGWLSKLYPLTLKVNGSQRLPQQLTDFESQLMQVPNKGLGFGLLCQHEIIKHKPGGPVLFNYLGQQRSNKSACLTPSGPLVLARDPAAPLCYALELHGYREQQKLVLGLVYSNTHCQSQEIADLAGRIISYMNKIMALNFIQAKEYELARLKPNDLDKLANLLRKI